MFSQKICKFINLSFANGLSPDHLKFADITLCFLSGERGSTKNLEKGITIFASRNR